MTSRLYILYYDIIITTQTQFTLRIVTTLGY